MNNEEILQAALGRWPEILVAIGGISRDQLCRREGPCPSCAVLSSDPGDTRFRWDGDSGNGSWFCSHCGGKDGRGGAGTGLDLLSRLRLKSWGRPAFAQTLQLVADEFFNSPVSKRRCTTRQTPLGSGPPATSRPPSEWQAFCWLEAADQLGDGETFSPARSKGGGYSSRWLRWSSETGVSSDQVAAAIAEGSTAAGLREIPDLDAPPQAPAPPGPQSLQQIRARLTELVVAGTSSTDLACALLEISENTEHTPASLRTLLQAIERQQAAVEKVAAEAQHLHAHTINTASSTQQICGLDVLFPPSLATSIRRLIEYLPIGEVTAATLFLGTVSGVQKLGNRVIASRRLAFSVPTNLYVAIVGRSGIKKDPAINALVNRPLAPISADLKRAHDRAMQEWKTANQGKKPADRTEQPGAIYATISEFTGESLSRQLQRHESRGLGLLISRPEIAGMFGSLNAYRGGRGGDTEQLLETYDGSAFSSLRITADGGGRFYDRCHVSITGGIQPEVLQNLVSDGDASGLWSRFLFAPIHGRVIALPSDDSDSEAKITHQAEQYLADLIADIYRSPQQVLILDPDARALFMAYEQRCQADAVRSDVDAMRSAWSKAPGKALRVAGLLHQIHQLAADGDRAAKAAEITTAHVDRAMALIDHLTSECLAMHRAAASGEAPSRLMALLHRVARQEGSPVGWRDLSRRLSARQKAEIDSSTALAAAQALEGLRVGEVGQGARGAWSYHAISDLPG